jgi:hypothetical protein
MKQGEFDLGESRVARDEGIGRVARNNEEFARAFWDYVLRLPRGKNGWVGTCEDIRRDWKGVRPRHHNAWGACWNTCKRKGLLAELPDQVQMQSVKSHARKTHLYRRT